MVDQSIVENKNHTIIGTMTRLILLCGECGKSWEAMGGGHWYECPHCKKGLPAWGLPQNIWPAWMGKHGSAGKSEELETQVFDAVSGRSLGPSD